MMKNKQRETKRKTEQQFQSIRTAKSCRASRSLLRQVSKCQFFALFLHLFFDVFSASFFERFGCPKGSIWESFFAPFRSRIALGHVSCSKTSIFTKTFKNQLFFYDFCSQDGCKNDPRSPQVGSKRSFFRSQISIKILD